MESSPSPLPSEGNNGQVPDFKILNDQSLKEYLHDAKERSTPPPKKELRDGRNLPKEYMEKFDPKTMACVPLEEIDPAYKNLKTFVVIGKLGTIHRYTARNTVATLSPLNPVRRMALYTTTHWLYSILMVAVVLLNIIALTYQMNKLINYSCIIVYAVEFILKVFCEGMIRDPFSYFRKTWNWVDFTVILASLIKPIQGIPLLYWLRSIKVIHVVPEIRRCCRPVVKSIAKLRTALLLTSFVIFFFALMGKELFKGTLTQRCISKDFSTELSVEVIEPSSWEGLDSSSSDSNESNSTDEEISSKAKLSPWERHASNPSNWYSNDLCIPGIHWQCPNDYACLNGFGPNPDYGFTNFDNFGSALIQTVRVVDQDYLERILNHLTKSNGPTLTLTFFTLTFFFGTYALGTFAYSLIAIYIFRKLDKKSASEDTFKREDEEIIEEEQLPTNSLRYKNTDHYQFLAQTVIKKDWFEAVITFTILVDIFGLSIPHHQMSDSIIQVTDGILLFVLVVYSVEFILKIYALGCKGYVKNGWNIFDFVVILDIIFWTVHDNYYLPFPFRIFKIAPRWSTLNITFKIICNSCKLLWGFLGLLITIWGYFSLIGKSEFRDDYLDNVELFDNEELPRWSFVDFFHSAMIVFRSWIGESIEVLGACLLVSDSECLIFISVVALSGSVILMILIVGVIFVTDRTLKCVPSQEPSILTKIFCYPFVWLKKQAVLYGICQKSQNNIQEEEELTEGQAKIIIASAPMGGSKVLRGVSTVIICVASLVLVLDNVPNRTNFDMQSFIYAVDVVFTIFFTIMSIYSLVVVGVQYCLTNPGWIFDVLVILEMILNVLYDTRSNPHPYPMFYLLRSLRPFMLVSRIERLEVVVRAILEELRLLWKFMIVGMFIWLSFGIMGIEMFSGAFSKCIDEEDGSRVNSSYASDKFECLANNYTWKNSEVNFDHIGKSFVSLALVGKRNSWVTILHDTFDFHSKFKNFQLEHDLNNFYFFLAFFIFGIFFAVSILFGVVYHCLEQFSGMFLTAEQRREFALTGDKPIEFGPKIYPIPQNKYRAKVNLFVSNHKFDIGIMLLIILDSILIACNSFASYDEQTSGHWKTEMTLGVIGTVILLLYVVELLLKIFGWGREFFQSTWNRMDFVIIFLVFLNHIALELGQGAINLNALRIFRLLRIFQFQPFISRAKLIRLYIQAFDKVNIRLKNILLFHLFIMYSYSLLGICKFGNVRLRKGLDSFFNFHTVSSSIRVLFMLSAMAGVDTILPVLTEEDNCTHDRMVKGEDYDEIQYGDCGSLFWGTLFVFSYSFFSFLNFMNLYFLFIFEITHQIKTHVIKPIHNEINEDATVKNEETEEELQENEKDQLKCNAFSKDIEGNSFNLNKPNKPCDNDTEDA